MGISSNVRSDFEDLTSIIIRRNHITVNGGPTMGPGGILFPVVSLVGTDLVQIHNNTIVSNAELAPLPPRYFDPNGPFGLMQMALPSYAKSPTLNFILFRSGGMKTLTITNNIFTGTARTANSKWTITVLALPATTLQVLALETLTFSGNVIDLPITQGAVIGVAFGPLRMSDSAFRRLELNSNIFTTSTGQLQLLWLLETRSTQKLQIEAKNNRIINNINDIVSQQRVLDSITIGLDTVIAGVDLPNLMSVPNAGALFSLVQIDKVGSGGASVALEDNRLSQTTIGAQQQQQQQRRSVCSFVNITVNTAAAPRLELDSGMDKTIDVSVSSSSSSSSSSSLAGCGVFSLVAGDSRIGTVTVADTDTVIVSGATSSALLSLAPPTSVSATVSHNRLSCIAGSATCSLLQLSPATTSPSGFVADTTSRAASAQLRFVANEFPLVPGKGSGGVFKACDLLRDPPSSASSSILAALLPSTSLLDASGPQCNVVRIGNGSIVSHDVSVEAFATTLAAAGALTRIRADGCYPVSSSVSHSNETSSLELTSTEFVVPKPPYRTSPATIANNVAQGVTMASAAFAAAVIPAMSFNVARQQAMVSLVDRARTGSCAGIDPEITPGPAESPTQMQLGDSIGKWFAGAAVGNFIFSLSLVLVAQLTGTLFLKRVGSGSWNRPFAVFARCHVAMVLFVCLSLLASPSLSMALVVVTVAEVPLGLRIVAMLFALLLAGTTAVYTIWALFKRERKEKYKKLPQQQQSPQQHKQQQPNFLQRGFTYWFEGAGEWVMPGGNKCTEQQHLAFDAANPQIDGFNSNAPWFSAVEFATQLGLALAGFIAQLVPEDKSCVTQAVVTVVVLTSYLALALWKRPFQELFLRIFTPIMVVCQIVICVIVAALASSGGIPAWIDALVVLTVSLQSVMSILVVLAAIAPMSKWIMKAWKRFRSRGRRNSNNTARSNVRSFELGRGRGASQQQGSVSLRNLLMQNDSDDDDGAVELQQQQRQQRRPGSRQQPQRQPSQRETPRRSSSLPSSPRNSRRDDDRHSRHDSNSGRLPPPPSARAEQQQQSRSRPTTSSSSSPRPQPSRQRSEENHQHQQQLRRAEPQRRQQERGQTPLPPASRTNSSSRRPAGSGVDSRQS